MQRCRYPWLVTLEGSHLSQKHGDHGSSGTTHDIIVVLNNFAFLRARWVSPNWHASLRDTADSVPLASALVFIRRLAGRARVLPPPAGGALAPVLFTCGRCPC